MTGIAVYTTPADPARAIVQTLVDTIKRDSFTEGYKATDAEAFGLLMARYFGWDSRILDAAARALEDANFHTESGQVAEMYQATLHADDDEPYDDDMRKALFARLGEVYGRGLTRTERLAKLSTIVERPVLTMSVRTTNPLTRGEFARAMRVLDTLVR